MVNITEQEFLKLTKKGNLIPVSREIPGDLDTPVSVYYKIAHDCDYSFLLESVEGEEKIARYSFLARDPEMVVRSSGQSISITGLTGKKPSTVTKKIVGSPLNYIREIMAPFKLVKVPGLPRFCGGLIGYLGYDTVRFFEELPAFITVVIALAILLLTLIYSLPQMMQREERFHGLLIGRIWSHPAGVSR